MTDIEAISIEDFIDDNYDKFKSVESVAEEGLTKIVRELPPDFHDDIRSKILKAAIPPWLFSEREPKSTLKVKLIIDANIIVQDSFRVAKGKFSSTDRILSSPYLELYSPVLIEEEVLRIIREKLPKDASLEKAESHAKKMLSHVNMVEDISDTSIDKASEVFQTHSQEDIPYFALAFEYEFDAIISKDKKAFDHQGEINRWDIKDTVVTTITYESGGVSFFVLGKSFEIVCKGLEELLFLILHVFETVMEIIIIFLSAIIKNSVKVLSKIPGWAWAIIAGVGAAFLVGIIISEGFRSWVGDVASKSAEVIGSFIDFIVDFGNCVWGGLKVIFIMLWNIAIPAVAFTIVIAGVLLRRVLNLVVEELKKAGYSNATEEG